MEKQKSNYIVPIAIVLAGLIIAGGIVYSNKSATDKTSPEQKIVAPKDEVVAQKDKILSVGRQVGSPTAKIVVAEFSDPECPFCGKFHTTMEMIMDAYGKNDDVAWRFINFFPFDSRPDAHPLSRPLAEAAECAGRVGGEDAYWGYMKLVFEQQENDRSYDIAGNAKAVGVDMTAFNTCLKDPAVKTAINEQHVLSTSLGIKGTPHSIVILPDGTGYRINGAYPYQTVAVTLDAALAGVKAGKIQTFLDMFQEKGVTEEAINAYVQAEFVPAITAANEAKAVVPTE